MVSKSSHEVEEDERQPDGARQSDGAAQAGDNGTSCSPAGARTTTAQRQTPTYVTSA